MTTTSSMRVKPELRVFFTDSEYYLLKVRKNPFIEW